jgi:hypothetical protein
MLAFLRQPTNKTSSAPMQYSEVMHHACACCYASCIHVIFRGREGGSQGGSERARGREGERGRERARGREGERATRDIESERARERGERGERGERERERARARERERAYKFVCIRDACSTFENTNLALPLICPASVHNSSQNVLCIGSQCDFSERKWKGERARRSWLRTGEGALLCGKHILPFLLPTCVSAGSFHHSRTTEFQIRLPGKHGAKCFGVGTGYL